MKIVRAFALWLPVVICAAGIFVLSGLPNPPQPEVPIPFLDKILHAVEYGGLSFLLLRAFRGAGMNLPFLKGLSLAILYALGDEFHQHFVPGRNANISDFLADSVGAALGGVAFAVASFRSMGEMRK
ncbi:MAG: VanZ family protein [bacterium]